MGMKLSCAAVKALISILIQVLKEKVEIENRLEQEQEYISNRLQKQVAETLKEKKALERMLEEEREKVPGLCLHNPKT